MKKMRRRMVFTNGAAARMIDLERQRGAWLQRALFHRAGMRQQVAGMFLRSGDAEAHTVAGHHTSTADLPAGFAVKRRLVENERARLAFSERRDLLAVAHQRCDNAFCGFSLVTEKFRGAELFTQAEPHRLVRGVAGAR